MVAVEALKLTRFVYALLCLDVGKVLFNDLTKNIVLAISSSYIKCNMISVKPFNIV